MERFGYATRDPDIRHLESASDSRRTRHDPDRHGAVRTPLRFTPREPRMNRRYVTVVRNILPITVAWLALPAAAAQLEASELARCAALAGSNERLACYDALAASVLPGATSVPPAATSALPGAAPAPAASTPPVASVAPAAQMTPVAAAVAGQSA